MKVTRDRNGCCWQIEAFRPQDVKRFTPIPGFDVWWDRERLRKQDELLVIRQENQEDRADVVIMTLGQAYDLIAALCKAVEDH